MSIKKISKDQPDKFEFSADKLLEAKKILESDNSNFLVEIGELLTDRSSVNHIRRMEESKCDFYNSSRNFFQRSKFKKKIDKFNSSPFFKDSCIISNKFNRTVIFNRDRLHRAQNFFGKEPSNCRFTMIAFCNETT